MSDIVERLRKVTGDLPPDGHPILAAEAAAKIERLRERVEELEAALRKLDKSGGLGYDKHAWISAALAAKGGGT